MHPASSIVLFTVTAGVGYGMLVLGGLLLALGIVEAALPVALAVLLPGLGFVTVGLLASVRHLGRPERAWRAFSQVRTSWLSREGVAAVATYGAAVPLTLICALGPWPGPAPRVLGLATVALAVLTLVSTGMIYASLRPIPDWHHRWTVPVYLALAAMTGLLWAMTIGNAFGLGARLELPTVLAIAVAWGLKEISWRHVRTRAPIATAADATGLGRRRVDLFAAPHTETNYLMREMGYRVGRKHAATLRRAVRVAGFALPLLLSLALLSRPAAAVAAVVAPIAALSATLGVLAERWLFFAEARHTVTLYYGAAAV